MKKSRTVNSTDGSPESDGGSLVPVVQVGSADPIRSVGWSPDSRHLVTGGDDGVLRVYRAQDGRCERTILARGGSIDAVVVHPALNIIASAGKGGAIKLWDLETGELLKTLLGHTECVNCLSFDPTGALLASGSYDKTTKVWETETGNLLRTFDGRAPISSVAFGRDNFRLAAGDDCATAMIWDVRDGQLLHTFDARGDQEADVLKDPLASDPEYTYVAFDWKGKVFATGCEGIGIPRYADAIKLWNAATGKPGRTFQCNLKGLAFDRRGVLAYGSGSAVVLFDSATGKKLRTLDDHANHVTSISYSPDFKALASSSFDCSVKIWDPETGNLLQTLAPVHSIESVAIDPKGQFLATGSTDNSVRIWNATTGQLAHTLTGHLHSVTSLCFDSQGWSLASGSGDRSVRVWDPENGTLITTLEGHTNLVRSVSFHPYEWKLATASWDGTARIWDLSTENSSIAIQGDDFVDSGAFHPGGKMLAVGFGENEKVCLYAFDDCEATLVSTLETGGSVNFIAFDPSGKLLASGGPPLQIWHVETGERLWTRGGSNEIVSGGFDATGQLLATGSEDQTVKLWDSTTGKMIKKLGGHHGSVNSVVFAPNGRSLVAGETGRIAFWDLERFEALLYLYAFEPDAWLALLPDGRFDASPAGMRYLCYTKGNSPDTLPSEHVAAEMRSPQAVQDIWSRVFSRHS